jgi:hypothetical protein
MRWMHKRWQNKRPGWTRRVTWYKGHDDVRLKFEDETGIANRTYRSHVVADMMFEGFVRGEVTVQSLLDTEDAVKHTPPLRSFGD